MARSYSITNDAAVVLGQVDPGHSGRWFIQVTAYSGLTGLTPELSVDGTTYVTSGITPYSRGAVVTTMGATGGWILDAGCCYARISGVGTGTATVVVMPAID